MTRILNWLGAALAAAALAGCAHPYSVQPDLNKISSDSSAQRIDATADFYIPQEDLDKQVTTPAAAGDKIRYQPYKDIQAGFYKMLGNVFAQVNKIRTPTPTTAPSDGAVYVIRPTIATTSSGTGFMFWPPTAMSMTLTCTITDPSGKQIAQISVVGEGASTSSEYLKNFNLTGERASVAALSKMQAALLAAPELKH